MNIMSKKNYDELFGNINTIIPSDIEVHIVLKYNSKDFHEKIDTHEFQSEITAAVVDAIENNLGYGYYILTK